MLTTIVVPHDGSSLADRAVPYAARLAGASGGRLVLLRVTPPMPWGPNPEADRRARKELSLVVERLGAGGQRAELCVEHGYIEETGQVVAQVARREAAELIVMATHGQGGLGRWVFGSVAEEVVRRAEMPVLLVPSGCQQPWPSDRPPRVLVPLDGSDLARLALGPAELLAATLGAELLLVEVCGPRGSGRHEDAPAPATDLVPVKERLQTLAAPLLAAGRRIEIHAAVGDAAAKIVDLAAELRADLIVMATHGRGGISGLLLGSVASATLRRTTVPLLLVRPVGGQASTEEPAGQTTHPPSALVLNRSELELIRQGLQKLLVGEHPAPAARALLARLPEAERLTGDPAAEEPPPHEPTQPWAAATPRRPGP